MQLVLAQAKPKPNPTIELTICAPGSLSAEAAVPE
jgi:hypothetical protein